MSAASGLPGPGPCPRPVPSRPATEPFPAPSAASPGPPLGSLREGFSLSTVPARAAPGPDPPPARGLRGGRRKSPVAGEGSASLPTPGVLLSCGTPEYRMLWVLEACQGSGERGAFSVCA